MPQQNVLADHSDDLIALDEWPSVSSDYVIARGEHGSPELTVTLRFNADVYVRAGDPDAGREMALTDLGKFQLIYSQLTQSGVNVTLGSTMQAASAESAGSAPISAEVSAQLEEAIAQISVAS